MNPMKSILIFLIISIISLPALSQDLSYYLPQNVAYSPDIPSPESVIGHKVGEYHITHDRLVYYLYRLSQVSDRVAIDTFGYTHEKRPQILLTITSPDNLQNLENIKADHLKLTDPDQSAAMDLNDMPAIVWQGYSIHGNEASGSNAAMLAAYHYAAATGDEIEDLLANVVILLDPSFNPDGLTRFSTWVNSRRSKNLVADPYNAEQNEFWPGGRTNHYWFDLNRDWLPVQQPESQGRIKVFHEWKPNILTDHHEMGTNSTFFFQPGIPSRNNPNTPRNNYVLTERIGEFHAAALDQIGSLYYSKESYDDFYYGKGSTFPDINGGIGILFEQASSRGHVQDSDHGKLTFPFAIRNQFVTSLSTVEAAKNLRVDLLEHQRTFFKEARKMASDNSQKGVIFGNENDPSKSLELAKVLNRHKIEVYPVNKFTRINGTKFYEGNSYYVPFDQPQYRLIDIMFETVTEFQDSLFYDVSSWTLPMAFGLDYEFVDGRAAGSISRADRFEPAEKPEAPEVQKSEYAYAIKWGNYFGPSVVYHLLTEGVICKVTNESLASSSRQYNRGSIIIPVAMQDMNSDQLFELVSSLSEKYGVPVESLSTGMTSGVNVGSRSMDALEKPEIAMLIEGGVRSYDAGEVWHLLDHRMDIDLSLLPFRVFEYANIDKYNTIIMADGYYNDLGDNSIKKLKEWVQKGGNIIAIKRANNWLSQQGIVKLDYVAGGPKLQERQDYQDANEFRGAQATGGAIFRTDLDISNPLGYGYNSREQYIFVNTNAFFQRSDNVFADPLVFDERPLASGYISEENLDRMKSSSVLRVNGVGRGRVISFAFNPNFRAFWYGTNSLFLNAILFGDIISGRTAD